MTNTPVILNTPTGIPYTLVRARVVSQLASPYPLSIFKMFLGHVNVGFVQADSETMAAQIARDVLQDDSVTVVIVK